MLHEVRNALGRLLRHRRGAQQDAPAQPMFDEAEFFAHLREPSGAVAAWRDGRQAAAWGTLVEHFTRRAPALGFVAPERVPALLAESQRRFPGWRERLLSKVYLDRHEGLAVYDRMAAPLDADFDWGVEVGGPLEDRLYGARPHRFGFLARWALACHYDERLVAPLEAVLANWMAAASPGGGHPGFKSSHVTVYHFVAVLLAWPFVAALETSGNAEALAALRRRILLILYEGCRFMRAAAGGAVANNHLLAERFADWLTAALLPEFDHALERTEAEASWLAELERQTYADGGSFEHSLHYQEHACEMATAYLILSRRNGWPIAEPALTRIEKMLVFQLALAEPGRVPMAFGNTTEDPLLALGVGEAWQSGLLREVQRACFAPQAVPAPAEDPGRETAFWLLEGGIEASCDVPGADETFQAFPDSGVCIFTEPERTVRLAFRLGPSPAAPGIGGHSHNDLLSLCMSVGDTAVLATAGTYSYRFKPHPDLSDRPNLRAHFASAASRSGFFLEGEEPYGSLKGDFRNWRLPCQVETRRASATGAGLSWSEGCVVGTGAYVGQRRGVVHVWGEYWLVYDNPPANRDGRPASVAWQFAPGINCQVGEETVAEAQPAAGDFCLRIQACGSEKPDVACGSSDPFRGWVSPSYGRLEAAANLRYPLKPGCSVAAFLLTLEPDSDLTFEQILNDDNGLGFHIASSEQEAILLLRHGEGSAEVLANGLTFDGRLLFLSDAPQGLQVRALGLRRLTAPRWSLQVSAEEPADFEVVIKDGVVDWPRGACPGLKLDYLRDGL